MGTRAVAAPVGLSIDKFGLAKIFGSSLDHGNGFAVSCVPSENEVIREKPASASTIGAVPGTPDPSQSKTSLLGQTPSDVSKEKKNRQNTLTVMVELFSQTIKNCMAKTPMGEMPAH